MPYEWEKQMNGAPEISGASSYEAGAAPLAILHLWPYRSLPRRGFVAFIAITCALILMPLIAVVGSPVLWGLLPFVAGAVALTWFLLERSYKDGTLLEELRLWPDRIELTRHNPRGPRQEWSSNPYWVRLRLHPEGGPVENYLTLKGRGREVELGAFLTPGERTALRDELQRALAALGA
ncbi:MAG: DUF2244 domain-containing protein [Confluentimicrobium sp.]|jgi:uncharacterized membrane protein|nr:integral membrane protein [Rhodovulum sp. NI22]MBC55544.1 DUF2244 domain-containing protein [Actibacterium sp.]